MTRRLRWALALTVPALALIVPGAPAATAVKLTPVKGATYAGVAQGRPISLKVDRKGHTAKISLTSAPAFCSSGAGPEPHSAKPATISSKGALSDTITFSTTGATSRKLATVVVKGHFYTFGKATPVFQGTVKVTYLIAGDSECNGQASFQAMKK
jgi:hypothetical protein